MTEQLHDRLVCFIYLLTRGTPHTAGMGWGEVKAIVREHLTPIGDRTIYTSPGGEALAHEIVHELLTGEPPPSETAQQPRKFDIESTRAVKYAAMDDARKQAVAL